MISKPQSTHLVDATVDVVMRSGEGTTVELHNIRCVWIWDEMSREAAELWSVIDYVANTFDFETFSVVSYTSTKAIEV